jgi:hypothetical protein
MNSITKEVKLLSGLVSVKVNKINPNIYYKINEKEKNAKILKHMATLLKVNGGYLIRKHTTQEKTFLDEGLTIETERGGVLIKHSNPFFYVNGDVFREYMTIEFDMRLFPKNFSLDKEEIGEELAENLRNGLIEFIKESRILSVSDKFKKRLIEEYKNDKLTEDQLKELLKENMINNHEKVLTFGEEKMYVDSIDPIKNNLFLKKSASYREKENNMMLVTPNSKTHNKKTSLIFFDSKDLDFNSLEEITKSVLNNDAGIGTELTKL